MFDTLGSFSVMFFILSAILILLVLFEKQCLELEEKFDAKIAKMKREKRQKNKNKAVQQNRQNAVKVQKKSQPYRKPRNFAA